MVDVDTVVIGLGAVGSAASMHLAARGRSVVGIDQYMPGHALSGSGDGMRTFRMAYFDDDTYVALAKRSEVLWRQLSQGSSVELFAQKGAVLLASRSHPVCQGVLRSAAQHDLEVDELRGDALRERCPGFGLAGGGYGLFERRAGVLQSLSCDARHRALAVEEGADLRTGVQAHSLAQVGDHIEVATSCGTITAPQVVLCCGPWVERSTLGGSLGLPITVVRQVQCDFTIDAQYVSAWARQGAWNLALDGQGSSYYGSGLRRGGYMTVGKHEGGVVCEAPTPGGPTREETDELVGVAADWLVGLHPVPRAARVGYYACTPDRAPIIGGHPKVRGLFVAMGLSGHGYKFAAGLGEHIAECLTARTPSVDLRSFCPSRFATTPKESCSP